MNFNNFTIKSQEAIQKAVDYVTRNGGQSIEAVHLLRGVIDVGDSLMDFVSRNGSQQGFVDTVARPFYCRAAESERR